MNSKLKKHGFNSGGNHHRSINNNNFEEHPYHHPSQDHTNISQAVGSEFLSDGRGSIIIRKNHANEYY